MKTVLERITRTTGLTGRTTPHGGRTTGHLYRTTGWYARTILYLYRTVRPEYLVLLLALLLFMAMVWLIHLQSYWACLPAFGLIILAILVKRES